MLPVESGALRTLDSFATERATNRDPNRDPNRDSDGQPDREVAGSDPECGAQRRSQRDT
jgi:hypothetical protein